MTGIVYLCVNANIGLLRAYIICVGKNYLEHVKGMGTGFPGFPVLSVKGTNVLNRLGGMIHVPDVGKIFRIMHWVTLA